MPDLLVTVGDDNSVDLKLGLTDLQLGSDGSCDFIATAQWEREPISVGAHISAEWDDQSFEDGPSALWGTLTFSRTGPESDAFLKTLAEVYDIEGAPTVMANQVGFSAAVVQGNPQRLQDGALHLRLFYNADDEERYAELYCVIDTQTQSVELRESDVDFRDAILAAFSIPDE